MFFVFLILWIVFNGKFTWEILFIGMAISAVMYGFICGFLGYRPAMDLWGIKKAGAVLQYFLVLLLEIVKAAFAVIRVIFSSRYEAEPAIVRFRVQLRTNAARVLLANSITLTPGTITASQEGDEYVVHCLDKSFAEGLDNSIFVTLLQKLEEEE